MINKVRKVILDDSVPISNNRNLMEWLVNCQTKSHLNKQKNLSKNLLVELESIFGSSNKSLRLEFMTKVWVLEYNGLVFNVFTAKGKGTSIEICGYEYKDIELPVNDKEWTIVGLSDKLTDFECRNSLGLSLDEYMNILIEKGIHKFKEWVVLI